MLVAALLDDGLDHAAMAVERVGGDEIAFQIGSASAPSGLSSGR
jgi:hypothetical protein